jgi:hypothetical protein
LSDPILDCSLLSWKPTARSSKENPLQILNLSLSVQAVGCWITWFIWSWVESSCCQTWANSENDNLAEEQQTLWAITPWWLSVSPWQICIPLFWRKSCLKLTAPSSRLKRHLQFASLDRSVSCYMSLSLLFYGSIIFTQKSQKLSFWVKSIDFYQLPQFCQQLIYSQLELNHVIFTANSQLLG